MVCARRGFSCFGGREIWHDFKRRKYRRLWDTYRFPSFRPSSAVHGIFGDPKARVIRLHRRGKKLSAESVATRIEPGTTAGCAEYATCRVGTLGSTWSWRFDVSTARDAAR